MIDEFTELPSLPTREQTVSPAPVASCDFPAASRKRKAHPHVFTQFDPGPVDRGPPSHPCGTPNPDFLGNRIRPLCSGGGAPRPGGRTCLSRADGKAASRPAECKPPADLERLEANQRRRGDV